MISGARKSVIILLVSFAVLHVDAAYGLKWKPGDDAAVASAYLVAENAFTLRMRQPDGKVRVFHRDFSQPSLLYGKPPWVGEDVGNGMFKIITNPDFKGGRTGFVFKDGHLRRMVLGRKDYQFEETPYPSSTNTLESLWPRELSSDEARKLFGTWQGEDSRWKLGFSNPNKAGCLCAELVLVGLALVLLGWRRRWIAICGVAVTLAAFVMLVLTASRGGMIACAVGAVTLVAFRIKIRRIFTLKCLCILAAIFALVGGIMVASGMGTRFTTKLVDTADESDSFRLKVWKAAPRMMLDAPCGWGLGVAGRAFTTWYQRPNEFKVVRTLVSSHFTWLVEFGWIGRFLYLTALFGTLWHLMSITRRGGNPLSLALLVSLSSAGIFNSVMESPLLWIPLAVSLVFLFGKGRVQMSWRNRGMSLTVGALAAILVLTSLAVYGTAKRNGPQIRASHDHVIVNGKSTKTWVVDDGVVLGGGLVGKELRMFYGAFPTEEAIGLVWSLDALPKDVKHLVLAGKSGVDFLERIKDSPDFMARFDTILFISPPFAASTLPESLLRHGGVKVIQGELAHTHIANAEKPSILKVIPGAELYIPAWMRYALKRENKES